MKGFAWILILGLLLLPAFSRGQGKPSQDPIKVSRLTSDVLKRNVGRLIEVRGVVDLADEPNKYRFSTGENSFDIVMRDPPPDLPTSFDLVVKVEKTATGYRLSEIKRTELPPPRPLPIPVSSSAPRSNPWFKIGALFCAFGILSIVLSTVRRIKHQRDQGDDEYRFARNIDSPRFDYSSASAVLTVCDGPETGRAFPLAEGRTAIGRAQDKGGAISLSKDPSVSRLHGEVFYSPERQSLTYRDSSRYGSLVDGKKIVGESARIQNGSIIEIGSYRLQVSLPTDTRAEMMSFGSARSKDTRSDGFVTGVDFGTTASSIQKEEIPAGSVDLVHFSVTSPPVVSPGSAFYVDLWAHLGDQRGEVLRRAREDAEDEKVAIKSKGPTKIERGAVLKATLQVSGCLVEPRQETILWAGEIGNATFVVNVPKDFSEGVGQGLVRIRANGFEVAKLHFILKVGATSRLTALPVREFRHQTAFASYSSEDSDAVLGRIQGMEKVAPNLDIFYAPEKLRSGDNWKDRLKQEILARDVMFLFWSTAASRSEWVDWEWRCGLKERGIDFIDPCPLVSPKVAPPPKELADEIHFNDWVLAHLRGNG